MARLFVARPHSGTPGALRTTLRAPLHELETGAPPEPVRAPLMLQGWHAITFLHWRYDPAALRRFVPAPLELDLFEGAAWVGLTPFLLEGLRLPFLPPLPWLSRFPETNLRTYVRGPGGRPGVWFFSLDTARLLAAAAARLSYGLPYWWSAQQVRISGERVRYLGRRRWGHPAAYHVEIETGAPIPPAQVSPLDLFLTARFRLYAQWSTRLASAPVEHPPWPLARARLHALEQTLTRAAGLPDPAGDPLLHYSPGVDVRIGRPRLWH